MSRAPQRASVPLRGAPEAPASGRGVTSLNLTAGPGSPDPAAILGRARKRGRKRRHEWTPRVNSSPPPLGKLADVWPQGR
jgi:hypothetical protein